MVFHNGENRHGTRPPVVLAADHPAVLEGRTNCPSSIRAAIPGDLPLMPGNYSAKLGRRVNKGARRGWPIFSLTLEERKTCPATCLQWTCCYGNKMGLAARWRDSPALRSAITIQLEELSLRHPEGFLLRLHLLGDFYSVEYTCWWLANLLRFPALHLFGFTAWPRDSDIGRIIDRISRRWWDRFAIRFSGGKGRSRNARVLDTDATGRTRFGIICPALTHSGVTCGSCSLCWATQLNVVFRAH